MIHVQSEDLRQSLQNDHIDPLAVLTRMVFIDFELIVITHIFLVSGLVDKPCHIPLIYIYIYKKIEHVRSKYSIGIIVCVSVQSRLQQGRPDLQSSPMSKVAALQTALERI